MSERPSGDEQGDSFWLVRVTFSGLSEPAQFSSGDEGLHYLSLSLVLSLSYPIICFNLVFLVAFTV